MNLNIAQLAPLWYEVPPLRYGGKERVVANINDGLAGLGQRVTLFAAKGSTCRGEVVEVMDQPLHDKLGKFNFTSVEAYEFKAFSKLFDRIGSFDIVHSHIGLHEAILGKILGKPMVTTYHSSLPPDFPFLIDELKGCRFISVSNAQRALIPDLNWIATVYNPVETDLFEPDYSEGKDYLLFLGALNKNKGIDIAVRAAKELGEKLVIAGMFMKDEDREWFNSEVLPDIDGERIRLLGEVNHEEKNNLYRNAKAFLFPSRWLEAFGLVMVEAMACGTPVIGMDSGSIPEVIRNGESGFVASTYEGFVQGIRDAGSISRKFCRTYAVDNFSVPVIAGKYLEVYRSVIDGRL